MIRLRYIFSAQRTAMGELIPVFGMMTGIIIPLAVFFWQYIEGKERRETILEISRTIDDPEKIDELLKMLEERKDPPSDNRRSGIITTFVGLGLYALGYFVFGSFFKGVGALVGLIGLGITIAGYLYPPSSHEINQAVEDFEKR